MGLPGMYSVRITQDLRIAVGRKTPQGHPEKLDHFLLTRWDAKHKRYVADAEATAALDKRLGTDGKPTRLPVCVLGNIVEVPDEMRPGRTRPEVPDSVLWRRMAYYWGKRCVCGCEDFRLKTQEEAAACDLAYPLDPNNRGSWCGQARRRRYQNGKLKDEKTVFCDPYSCPFATGEHDNEKYAGVPLCKPQAILTVQLDWLPKLGTVAKFVTSSWQSISKLRGSLIHIGAMNRGWTAMLPLWLVVNIETVSSEGWTGPIVHLEYEGDRKQLTEQTTEVLGQLGDIEDGLARIEAGSVKALDSGADAEAYAGEFAPETVDAEPSEAFGSGVVAYCRSMTDELGWSEGEWAARVSGIGDDAAEWDRLSDELEELTGRKVEPTPDAKPLDVSHIDPETDPFPDAPETKAAAEKKAKASKPKPNGKKSGEKKDSKKGKQETLIPDD